jgi:hypothetical protein
MGKPHPSHSFTMPHPTVYEFARVVRENKINLTYENLADEYFNFSQDEEVDCSSHHMRAFA